MQLLMSVMMAVMMSMMIPRAAASAERITEVMETKSSVADAERPIAISREAILRGVVSFENVEFRYPGAAHPVLSGITFTAHPGQMTAIVGSTGSGKSTLLNLIPRLIDPTLGTVAIAGTDIKQASLEDVWAEIGYVPQRALLFRGTVATNLRYGKEDASDDELWQALETAQAADFIREQELALQAPVAQGGTNFSGGQRQRLSIARAIAKEPKIYLLDDSFSALDYATDAKLRAALATAAADSTLIVVAQRVSTILHADQIIVLNEGRIDGIGKHAQLMESSQTYREIVLSQLSPEEAAS
jgi:ATP-binding cassette subfamily B protein